MNIPDLFEQDTKLLNELLFLLSREQISLVDMDIDAIEAMLDEKGRLLQRINASAQVRYKALFKAGFEPNENGMAAWVKTKSLLKHMEAWQSFQKTLEQAKEMNRLNGQLISKHFSRNQQMLNQLQGSGGSGVYGPNGQTSTKGYLRSAVSA